MKTTETEIEQTEQNLDAAATSAADKAAEEAAFVASFEGKEPTPPAAKLTDKAPATEPVVDDAAAKAAAAVAASPAAAATTPTPPAPKEATPTPAPPPKVDEAAEMRAELRKVYGRIGALTDELKTLKAGKEAEGKPAAATPVELKRLAVEYPELAPHLQQDLAEALAGLGAAKADPQEIDRLVSERVSTELAKEQARMRDAAVDDAHPTWRQDLFTEDPTTKEKKASAEYLAWRASIGEQAAKAFEGSTNPFHVIRQLNAFYEFRGKAAKADEAKKARLAAAVQPQGASRGGPPNLSDREAEMKGFEEGFNS